MILPFAPVIEWIFGCLVSVDVVCDLGRIKMKRANGGYQKKQVPEPL